MKYIVYCTTCLVNGFIYIGVHETIDPNKFDSYLGNGCYANKPSSYNKPKTKFQYAVQKYGPKKFKRAIIKVYDNEDDAYLLEADIVDSEFLKRPDVYNMVLGGKSGIEYLNAKPCYQYDLEGHFIAEYVSQQKASFAVGKGFTTIKRAIKEKIKAGGYFWSEEKVETLDLTKYKTTDNRIPVFQYSDTGEYDCCYESVADAARVNNSQSTNISRACKLGYKVNNKHFSYTFTSNYSKARKESLKNTKVYQYSLEGDFLAEYNTCSEAETAVGTKRGLSTAIKLDRTFGGYQWKLEKLDKIPSIVISGKARRVGQYDLNGNLIKIYNTVTQCKKDFSGCQHVLQGRRKTSGGYTFKYID